MNINDKIKQILIDKNLSPSYFADETGIQRSSISHILSGRNRPSFDIIQKIIRRFPELGYEWIMEDDSARQGNANYNPRSSSTRQFDERSDRLTAPRHSIGPLTNPTLVRSLRSEIAPAIPEEAMGVSSAEPTTTGGALANSADKKVERILIFYTDGTFREYSPSN